MEIYPTFKTTPVVAYVFAILVDHRLQGPALPQLVPISSFKAGVQMASDAEYRCLVASEAGAESVNDIRD